MEESLTKVQTQASQPPNPTISQQPPIQWLEIPISSPGYQDDKVMFADNKQDKERGPTYDHGDGGWDGPLPPPPPHHHQHQFIERSRSNNNNDPSPQFSIKPSTPDDRLSNITGDEGIRIIDKLFGRRQRFPNNKEDEGFYGNNVNVKQVPPLNDSYKVVATGTIDARNAARKYMGLSVVDHYRSSMQHSWGRLGTFKGSNA